MWRLWNTLLFLLIALPVSWRAFAAEPTAVKSLNWAGDMRYRFVQLRESVDEPRIYQQIRVRLGFKAEVQNDLTAVLRLATATSAISNNQTLGDSREPGMPRRSFGLDLAYGEWRFLESGRLSLGRITNPFFSPGRTQMVFDQDLVFEGAAVGWQPTWADSSAFLNAGGFIISENYSAPNDVVDTGLVGIDLGYSFKTSDFGRWTLHAARFHYLNIAERPVVSIEKDARVDAYSYPFDRVRGNTVFPNDPLAAPADRRYFYRYNFVQSNFGIEWKQKFDAVDVTGYGDWISNEQAGALGQAYEVGVIVRHGRAQLLIAQSVKKSDSIVGAFTDSDFNGGGTDNRGYKINLSYQLSDSSSIGFSDYHATRGIDSVSRDYAAQHLDFSLQF